VPLAHRVRPVFNTERGFGHDHGQCPQGAGPGGPDAQLPLHVHPHMLRHACGFTLANKGTDTRTIQAYLGHRSIQHTVRYTELAPGRFQGLFDD